MIEHAERLSAIVYLDIKTGYLVESISNVQRYQQDWPCRMTKDEWVKVIINVQNDNYLNRLQILKIEEKDGHKAVLFSDMIGHGYAIFRGTGNDREWEDNAHGMFEPDTTHQQMAARFVQQYCKNFKRVTVAGHSKGGNKAQYAAITLPQGCINNCFSFDGQGFSVAFFEKYADEIKKRKDIINLVSERRGFVHALGLMVADTKYYTGWRGTHREGLLHGDSLPYFHCPDALRNLEGKIGEKSLQNLIPTIVNTIVVNFLKTPEYSSYVKPTSRGLTMLMFENKTEESKEESATAIARLLMVFIDLIATNKDFKKQVKKMTLVEADVLLATLGTAGKLSDMGKKASHKLAHLLLANRRARLHFFKATAFIIDLRKSLTTGRHAKLSAIIIESINIVLRIVR